MTGRQARLLRRISGMSMDELGRRIGRPASWVSRWERGYLQATDEDIEKINAVLKGDESPDAELDGPGEQSA